MKKLLYIVLPFLCILNLVSCSSFVNEKTGSLTIQFNAEDFEPARAADSVSQNGNYYISLKISDGYTYNEIIDLSTERSYSATFDSISIGSNINVEVNVFNPFVITTDMDRDGEIYPYHSYQGKTSKKIQAGQNIIELSLNSLLDCSRNSNDSHPEWKNTSFGLDVTSSANFNNPTLYLFNNGKYQIYGYDGWGDNQKYLVYSEGIWEGDWNSFRKGGIVKFTEYIYLDLVQGEDFLEISSPESFTIVKNPKAQNVEFNCPEGYEMVTSFTFDSLSGVRYSMIY